MRLEAENFKQAVLAGLLCWFVAGLVTLELVMSFAAALLLGLVFLAAVSLLPLLKRRKFSALVEKDLPFALMHISLELKLRVPFQTCIRHAAHEGYGLASEELSRAVAEIEGRGSSVQQALIHFSERVNSVAVKRAVMHLVNIYEQGSGAIAGNSVKRLAVELMEKQKAESREFSGKLVVFSLLFIAVSAVVPALFQSFIVVGSLILKMRFTALQMLLVTVVGFPLVDLAVLFYIKEKMPVSMRD